MICNANCIELSECRRFEKFISLIRREEKNNKISTKKIKEIATILFSNLSKIHGVLSHYSILKTTENNVSEY